jgi:hypothetical protein
MLLFLSEIFLVCWFIYAIKKIKGSGSKWIWSLVVISIELGKFLMIVGGFLIRDILYLAVLLTILQLIVSCIYRIKYISIGRLLAGFVLFAILAIFMYYNGSVEGPMTVWISDHGGMVQPPNYHLYRLSTYLCDCVIPFSLLFNLIISPFWKRKSNEGPSLNA